jgi:hypothetical protein
MRQSRLCLKEDVEILFFFWQLLSGRRLNEEIDSGQGSA